MQFSTVERQSMTNTGLIPQPPSGSSCILTDRVRNPSHRRRGMYILYPVLRAAVARKDAGTYSAAHPIQRSRPPETSS
ncbi:hypothetical protein CCMA1212_010563 [Trichoderma ghanense]|uniref:Uncharacterized protein n=1 Tax=Trichoderma ghanense TaxID=65468 RepID=A0ABY2GPU1_9HYPO